MIHRYFLWLIWKCSSAKFGSEKANACTLAIWLKASLNKDAISISSSTTATNTGKAFCLSNVGAKLFECWLFKFLIQVIVIFRVNIINDIKKIPRSLELNLSRMNQTNHIASSLLLNVQVFEIGSNCRAWYYRRSLFLLRPENLFSWLLPVFLTACNAETKLISWRNEIWKAWLPSCRLNYKIEHRRTFRRTVFYLFYSIII